MSTELSRALEQVAARSRGVRLWGGLAVCWTAFALAGWGFSALVARPGDETYPAGLLAGGAILVASASGSPCSPAVVARPAQVARQVEANSRAGTGLWRRSRRSHPRRAGRASFRPP